MDAARLVILLLTLPALGGCLAADPLAATVEREAEAPRVASAPGALAFDVLDYALGLELFEDHQGHAFPMHLRGSLHVPEGQGPFPVLVFVHGYHGTCTYPLVPELPTYWGNSTPGPYGACPRASPVVEPAESFRGYDYFSGALASQGYVVASVDANELNDNWVGTFRGSDWYLRARLVLRTLDHLREAEGGAGPLGELLAGRLDMERVGIMGHSRGGQAVVTAQMLNSERPENERHAIRAVFGLAPVDIPQFDTHVRGAAYATLLPYCDGDVWSLVGARTFDRSIHLDDAWPKYQFTVYGSNHNFYNTRWAANGSDAKWMTDPDCGRPAPEGILLSLEDTLLHGGEIMSAFFRAHVGGEDAFLPLLRGEVPLPPEACPRVAVDCAGLLRVAHHPGAPDRLVVESGRDGRALRENAFGGASRLDGFAAAEVCEPRDCPGQWNTGWEPQLHLGWSSPARWTTEIPEPHRDVASWSWLGLRVGANPGGGTHDVLVVLRDGAGREASVRGSEWRPAVLEPPADGGGSDPAPLATVFGRGDQNARVVLSDVRVPLAAFVGVDLRDVREITLTFETGRGSVQVADLMLGR